MIRALVEKDFVSCRAWILVFALASMTVSALSVLLFPPGHDRLLLMRGTVGALVLSAGMGFAWNMVSLERKRRHLVLLRTLPVSSRSVIYAKFLAGLSMATLVLLCSELPWMAAGVGMKMEVLAGTLLALGFYTALTLCLTVVFRNPIGALIPFYCVLMLGFGFREELMALMVLAAAFAYLLVPLTALAMFGSLELAGWVLGRREVDL